MNVRVSVITQEQIEAAMNRAAVVATAAFLEVREATNTNFRDGACTYGEMKAAINNAAHVMDAVRKAAGFDAWVFSDGDAA